MNENLIAERIKYAREKLGITKAEASRRLNLSKIGYCRYEYGERTPSIQTLEVIARCFNTSVDFLTGKTEDFQPDYIVVSKQDNPAMFELISSLQSSDNASTEKILAYFNAIKEEMDK